MSLARRGAAPGLAPDRPRPESLGALRDLHAARRSLVADRIAERTRARTADLPPIRRQIARRLTQIIGRIATPDAEIARRIDADPGLARRRTILESIPGIAGITAAALPIDMPELGAARAASLAGLAPVERPSGRWTGRARLRRRPRAPAPPALHARLLGRTNQCRPRPVQ